MRQTLNKKAISNISFVCAQIWHNNCKSNSTGGEA